MKKLRSMKMYFFLPEVVLWFSLSGIAISSCDVCNLRCTLSIMSRILSMLPHSGSVALRGGSWWLFLCDPRRILMSGSYAGHWISFILTKLGNHTPTWWVWGRQLWRMQMKIRTPKTEKNRHDFVHTYLIAFKLHLENTTIPALWLFDDCNIMPIKVKLLDFMTGTSVVVIVRSRGNQMRFFPLNSPKWTFPRNS